MDDKKTVAIIGCGVAGLSAVKSMLETRALLPIAFEKTDKLGGIWKKSSDCVWPGLDANTSKFNMSYSDFPWNADDTLFPSADNLADYLVRYAKHFNLESYIQYNCLVTYVNQLDDGRWIVKWTGTTNGNLYEYVFDCVVLASGKFSMPYLPTSYTNVTEFKGKLTHSRFYHNFKTNEKIKGKKIIVVGQAPSAAEISSDLARQGASVVNIFKRTYWIINKLVRFDLNDRSKRLPYEFIIFTRKMIEEAKKFKSIEEDTRFKNGLLSILCAEQNQLNNENLSMDPNSCDDVPLSLSDDYVEQVAKGNITPIKGNIKTFYERGVILDDGNIIDADAIILCTGYYAGLDFLDAKILAKIEYDRKNLKQPVILYKSTCHPDLKNFACLGVVSYPYWCVCELQGRWASLVFSGKVSLPPKDVMLKYMDKKRDYRIHPVQIPRLGIQLLADEIANEIGALPDFEKLKESDPEIYKLLWEGGLLAAHYRITDSSLKGNVLKLMHEAYDIIKKVIPAN